MTAKYKMELLIGHARLETEYGFCGEYWEDWKDYGFETNFKRAKKFMDDELRKEPGAKFYIITDIQTNRSYYSYNGFWKQF